jgi:hypothetical protein
MHPAGSPASAPPSSVVGLKPARQPQCEYSYDHSYASSLGPARYRPSLPLHSKERPSTLQSRSKQGGLQPTVTKGVGSASALRLLSRPQSCAACSLVATARFWHGRTRREPNGLQGKSIYRWSHTASSQTGPCNQLQMLSTGQV